MKNAVLVIFLLLTFVSCSKDDLANPNEILIRIENTSEFDFKNVIVNTSGGENNYGDLDAHQISDYKIFELAYSYAFIELKIDGEMYTVQPIDYVGESTLYTGKYTYVINANSSGNQYDRLSLTLVTD